MFYSTPAEVTAHLGDVAEATPVAIDTAIVALDHMAGIPTAILESDSDAVTDAAREEARKLLAEIDQAVAPLHSEYLRRPWQRWWWVPGGHLHRTNGPTPGNPGMDACTTLWPTTDVRWAPKVAGFDDQGAVEKYGIRVCTTCVPSAPTLDGYAGPGSLEREEAEARGRCLNKVPTFDEDDCRPRWTVKWAKCAQCKAYAVALTRNGFLREHENATWRNDQDRMARLDPDSKLIGTPTGDELRVKTAIGTEVVKTVVTARNMYVAALVHAAWSRWYIEQDAKSGTDNYSGAPSSIVEHEAEARVLAEALAAKARTTVDEFVASMAEKVAKKIRKEIPS